MTGISEISKYIVDKLMPINPAKIILFGSYAQGNPHKDSDIDIFVVTNDKTIPANYTERIEMSLKVSKLLRELNNDYAIDLIVHTQAMYDLFIEQGSMFSKDIMNKGKILYERDNKGMA